MPIDKDVVAYLKYFHGSYNALVFLLFIYQGVMGITIRKNRKAGAPDILIIKRHRKLGPALAFFGPLGFVIGFAVTLMDAGHFLHHPLHFSLGLAIACMILTTFIISRNIKGPDSPQRKPHLIVGLAILLLYPVQAFLGLGILL